MWEIVRHVPDTPNLLGSLFLRYQKFLFNGLVGHMPAVIPASCKSLMLPIRKQDPVSLVSDTPEAVR